MWCLNVVITFAISVTLDGNQPKMKNIPEIIISSTDFWLVASSADTNSLIQSKIFIWFHFYSKYLNYNSIIIINFHFRLFFVSLTTDKRLTDSSSKIEMIVQKVIELKKIDPNVKIVIFSQWSNILSYIEMAMISTNISFRSKLERFHQTIQQFKVRVSCALLFSFIHK